MYEITPNILEKELTEIEKKIELVRPFAKTIQIDIADGIMVPNTTFLDPQPFKKYTKDIFFEVHMMVDNPLKYLQPWADAGFKRFIGQVEKMPNQEEFVAQGQLLGEVGLALDGPTSIDAIKVPYEDLDIILIYTSGKAGFSGPPFLSERLDKIREIRAKNSTISIAVDGGINDQTIVMAKDAGANHFGTTSFLFSNNPLEQYKKLKQAINLQ